MPEKEVRLIDANEIVKVAEHAYNQWNLAMVGADDTRKVNEVFKKQYLCKVVKAVAENCPTIDPESLRPHGKPVPHYKSLCNSDGEPIITHPFGYECPFCGDPDIKKFCPNCGAKLER